MEAARVELDREVDRFVKLSTDLHRVLDGRNKQAAGKLWAPRSDVRAGSGQFADAYEEVVHQPMRDAHAPRDIHGRPAHQRVVVATKALVYFVRSYQDGLVGSANVLSGGAWGSYTSMGNALNRNGLVSKLANEVTELAEYRDWFTEWRDVRNARPTIQRRTVRSMRRLAQAFSGERPARVSSYSHPLLLAVLGPIPVGACGAKRRA